ncbi:hypothetical protein B0H63DRAFT_523642 [Podospora didyma]|uniref:Uncharacterized protein n=1 Tax=Podospora didyma TaxID=330526 RepID=A0AAE0TVE0_9PEZI|nr:hypothetical protein B0H63DRAFT_523642 [Podospora didyma]
MPKIPPRFSLDLGHDVKEMSICNGRLEVENGTATAVATVAPAAPAATPASTPGQDDKTLPIVIMVFGGICILAAIGFWDKFAHLRIKRRIEARRERREENRTRV